MDVTLTPATAPPTGSIRPPGSKSLTNRALIMAVLGGGVSELRGVLVADDTAVMLDGLRTLGFELEQDGDVLAVRGLGGRVPAESAKLFCGNSGTTIRFLTALCTLGRGEFTLDGVERMRHRPIGPLVDLLRNLGGRVHRTANPPVSISGRGRLPGGIARYGSESSSQFLSAALMVSPYTTHETHILLDGMQTSWPYVGMTMRLMDLFGVTPELSRDPKTHEPTAITIPNFAYAPTDYAVEPDASAASYFLALAAVHPGSKVTVEGLGNHSLQGDVHLPAVLRKMGVTVDVTADAMTAIGPERLAGIEADLADMPDVAQTVAVVAAFARGQTRLRGLHTLRVKETDRLAALSAELSKLGADVAIHGDDELVIDPPLRVKGGVAIETYDDHRMAMSFAIAGTRVKDLTLKDAGCCSKTYPRFFEDLQTLL